MSTPAFLRVAESGARRYRHTWRASVFTSFLNPVLLLVAMGVGLGSLVEEGPAGFTYLTWLSPGLLAATAMQTAAGESAYPVMAGIKWIKSYDAALATPIVVRDLVLGHVTWATVRVAQVTAAFTLVIVAFGAVSVVQGLLAIGPAVLTGLAFAGLITTYTARLEDDTGLASLFRFGIVPLFLFSGTFFPIEQLPDLMETVAYLTPLWHGVELSRWLAIGLETTFSPLLHAGYLALLSVAGIWLAIRQMRSRLVT